MILISNHFWHKRTNDNFDPYNVLLAIATNILVLLNVLQGHTLHGNHSTFDLVISQKCICDSEKLKRTHLHKGSWTCAQLNGFRSPP